MIFLPTKSDPVKLIMSTLGWVVRCSPAATSPVTTFSTPGGSSAASAISPSTNASIGVNGEGLSTTLLPADSAGTTFDRLRYSGKLNGVIAATTPTGSLRITPWPRPRALTCGGSGSWNGKLAVRSANHCAYLKPVSNCRPSATHRAAPASAMIRSTSSALRSATVCMKRSRASDR